MGCRAIPEAHGKNEKEIQNKMSFLGLGAACQGVAPGSTLCTAIVFKGWLPNDNEMKTNFLPSEAAILRCIHQFQYVHEMSGSHGVPWPPHLIPNHEVVASPPAVPPRDGASLTSHPAVLWVRAAAGLGACCLPRCFLTAAGAHASSPPAHVD